MNDWIEEVTSLLFTSNFMTLATADGDGLPWVSPVEFACDEDLRFYWYSAFDARHSENVRANPRAALSIYDCTLRAYPGRIL
jgi:nitroimidazol reductase NimA-like FMN-containing flavoprotein (pyridoxamine 5'-phosphate oxidase superfamily)